MGCLDGQILLTGGSGTLGHAMLLYAEREKREATFTIFARSESRLAAMKRRFPRIRTIAGDVRDPLALHHVVPGHDLVIHMAAMKRIPECEQWPIECIATNVTGTKNVLDACVVTNTPAVVISTDKACEAATTYGASKLLTESLMQAASRVPFVDAKFTGVRYGNVIASTGSVVQLWQEQASRGEALTLTHPAMTRFWMSPFAAVRLIEWALSVETGTIVVPKMKSLDLAAMAWMLHPDAETRVVGTRSNEKGHEDLIHPYEPVHETDDHFYVRVGSNEPTGSAYSSLTAPRLTRPELIHMLAEAQEVESCK